MSVKHEWKLIEGYEDWKIWPVYDKLYFECIRSAAASAITSWEEINLIITDQQLFNADELRLVDLAENIVNQAAIISRYFFPTTDRRNSAKNTIHQLRGEKLREMYQIKSDTILTDRSVRNHIEHFDENLDRFLNKPVAGMIYPKTVFISSDNINPVSHLFKAYVVNNFKFISLDEEIDLRIIMKEIFDIFNSSIGFNK